MIAHLVRAGKEVIDAVNCKESLIDINIAPASPAPGQQTLLYRWPPSTSEWQGQHLQTTGEALAPPPA